jgi:hypothetical protein
MTDPARHPEPDAGDPRPWEQPGAVRRDAAPHRAYLLATLGRLPLAFGLLSLIERHLAQPPRLVAPELDEAPVVGGAGVRCASRQRFGCKSLSR